jgi:hypothetical protein
MAAQVLSMNPHASRVAAVAIAAIAVHAAAAVATGDPTATATAEHVKTHATSLAAALNAAATSPAASPDVTSSDETNRVGTNRAATSRAGTNRDLWNRSASLRKGEMPRPRSRRRATGHELGAHGGAGAAGVAAPAIAIRAWAARVAHRASATCRSTPRRVLMGIPVSEKWVGPDQASPRAARSTRATILCRGADPAPAGRPRAHRSALTKARHGCPRPLPVRRRGRHLTPSPSVRPSRRRRSSDLTWFGLLHRPRRANRASKALLVTSSGAHIAPDRPLASGDQ